VRRRSAGTSGRAVATLAAVAAALCVAVVVGPPWLAARGPDADLADHRHLTEALRGGFVEYWRSGDRDLSPALARVVDYWFRFHLAKALIAAILLVVLVALGRLLWSAFLRAGGLGAGRRAAPAAAGVLVTLLALVSLLVVMANVQGVVAPFASLLPMLTDGGADGEQAATLTEVRQQLAAYRGAGAPPAVAVMVDDFALYHAAMVVIGAIVAVGFVVACVASWTRRARTASSDTRARRLLASFGLLSALPALAAIVLVTANATVAADPAPALLALFDGGW
jgi:hypothetical protein